MPRYARGKHFDRTHGGQKHGGDGGPPRRPGGHRRRLPGGDEQFIDSNPGLRSRFTHYIDFPDYSPAELVQVFQGFATTAKVELGDDVAERLGHLFLIASEVGNFGNARYARSIFELAYANMATRAVADGTIERTEVDQLTVADPNRAPFRTATRRIGFPPGDAVGTMRPPLANTRTKRDVRRTRCASLTDGAGWPVWSPPPASCSRPVHRAAPRRPRGRRCRAVRRGVSRRTVVAASVAPSTAAADPTTCWRRSRRPVVIRSHRPRLPAAVRPSTRRRHVQGL